MSEFLNVYDIPKLNQDEMYNLNTSRFIASNDIEAVIWKIYPSMEEKVVVGNKRGAGGELGRFDPNILYVCKNI